MTSFRKLTSTGIATIAVVAGGLLATSSPVSAKQLYLHDSSFGPGGPGSGAFASIQSLTVDPSSGDVYVYDGGAGSVYKFSASGEPAEFTSSHTNVIEGVGSGVPRASFSQIAVDSSSGPASGDIYVASGGHHLGIYGADGSSLGELSEQVITEVPGAPWGEPCGVTVDAAGNVYLGLYSQRVSKYTPTANPVANTDYSSSLEAFNGICNLAVDGEGHVYALHAYNFFTRRYETSQFGSGVETAGTEVDVGGTAVAVDPATNDVFVDEGASIAQFDSAGNLIRRFATLAKGSYGVAINGSTKELYVANSVSGQVDALRLVDVPLPDINDQPPAASVIARTTAGLSGTIDPHGYETNYRFVYGPTSSYLHTTSVRNAGVGSGDELVGPVAIEGLLPSTTYHYALVAENPAGVSTSPDQTFTTAAATPPVVVTGAPSGVSQTAATLSGSVDLRGLGGTYGFELGTSAGEYGPRIGLGKVKASGEALTATLSIPGLQPGTSYHYRVTATNSDGTSYGTDQTVTTAVLASAAVTAPAAPALFTTAVVGFPKEASGTSTTKASTNAQKLAKALKACRKKAKGKRAACERQARRKYPTARKKAKKKK